MSPLQVNGQVSYAYYTKIKKPQQNTLARLCEPRIEHLIVKGIAKVVKQSLQLVKPEIASPAITYIKLNATCWRDRKNG